MSGEQLVVVKDAIILGLLNTSVFFSVDGSVSCGYFVREVNIRLNTKRVLHLTFIIAKSWKCVYKTKTHQVRVLRKLGRCAVSFDILYMILLGIGTQLCHLFTNYIFFFWRRNGILVFKNVANMVLSTNQSIYCNVPTTATATYECPWYVCWFGLYKSTFGGLCFSKLEVIFNLTSYHTTFDLIPHFWLYLTTKLEPTTMKQENNNWCRPRMRF